MGNKPATTAEDEQFINLILVAKENSEIGDRLRAILSQDEFNRHSTLNAWLDEIRLRKGPADFVAALSNLLDDDVAAAALRELRAAQDD